MGNNSFPKFIFRLSRFPVCRGSVLDRFYCIINVYVLWTKCVGFVTLYFKSYGMVSVDAPTGRNTPEECSAKLRTRNLVHDRVF